MDHLNISPVCRVGQVEIEESYKTSLFQETEGEIYQESEILDPSWYCVFRALPLDPTRTLPWTHWVLTAPQTPAE